MEALVDQFFPHLSACTPVIEAGCGTGPFLKALPSDVPAVGVEIDPALAQAAHANTGRTIICADFLTAPISFEPAVILGNPPFSLDVVKGFLGRAFELLPENGQCGFILPTTCFKSCRTVMKWSEQWSMRQEIIPQTLFSRLSLPIVFALFTKERIRTMVGFALFDKLAEVQGMPRRLKSLLIAPPPRTSPWRAVVTEVLRSLGGEASLPAIYDLVYPKRPTSNPWWKEKVRQVIRHPSFEMVESGRYRLVGVDDNLFEA